MSQRPCGSKTRAKNRYSRKELETLAKEKGIANFTSKTMDQLCQELGIVTLGQKQKENSELVQIVPPPSTSTFGSVLKKVVGITSKKGLAATTPERPCGTRAKGTSRYTRKELERLAKARGITKISSKTMDQLCQELGLIGGKKVEKTVSTLEILKPTSQQKKTQQDGKKCIIDYERPCSKSMKHKNRYTLTELRKLWNSECKNLPEFIGEKPKTIDNYCVLMRKRYARLHFTPLQTVPTAIKETLLRWIHKVKKPVKSLYVIFAPFPMYSFNVGPIEPDGSNYRVLKHWNILFEEETAKKHIVKNNTAVHRICNRFELWDSKKAKKDKNYLYNQNLEHFPLEYIQKQADYVQSLSPFEKYRVLGYTHAGDKIVNSFLRGNFDPINVLQANFKNEYTQNHLFPLALDFYDYIRELTFSQFLSLFFNDNLTEEQKIRMGLTYRNIVDPAQSFIQNYMGIIDMITEYVIHIQVWETIIQRYIQHLVVIIDRAPPVPKGGMFVYRGVKETGFLNIDPRKNTFTNQTFMSTSIDLCTSVGTPFVDYVSQCCVFVIQVLPGTKTLFMGSLSYYKETEFLFAPGSLLYLSRTRAFASNVPLHVLRFALVN